MARPVTWSTGPWKRVRNTPNPFNNAPDELVAATNIYLQDTVNGSGAFARVGYRIWNPSAPLAGKGQCAFCNYVAPNDALQNFVIAGGHLYSYNENDAVTPFVDVTPTGVTIDPDVDHVYMVSFNGHLVVSDGIHRPWIATNLSSVPVTGTYIDIDGSGTSWNARGKPVVYGGSLVFILNGYNGIGFETDIVWSAPGDPATGYIQNPYDFRWTLQQTASDRIIALHGTNLALYYFRGYSIGALTGTPATAGKTSGSDFRNSSTQDAIAGNVGCGESDTIVQYGNNIFFADTLGRPWMMSLGGLPQPIWKQAETLIEAGRSFAIMGNPTFVASKYSASLEGLHGLYLVACTPQDIFSGPFVSQQNLAFDALTGTFEGVWYIGTAPGTFIEAQGTIFNTGAERHMVVGTKVSTTGAATGYVWVQEPGWGDGDYNGGTPVLPEINVVTPRFGFNANKVQNLDRVTAITGTDFQVSMTVTTPQDTVTVAPTPSTASTDGTFRAIAGVQLFGRGVTVDVTPQGTDVSAQWSVEQIVAQGTECLAGPDDV